MADFDFSVLPLPFEKGWWCDADERMFQACFAILGQFVEEELGPPSEEWPQHRGYRLHSANGTDEKAIDLWLWYKTELPEIERAYTEDTNECFSGKLVTEPVEGMPFRRVMSFGNVRESKWPSDDFDETLDRYDQMFLLDRRIQKLRRRAIALAAIAMLYIAMWLLLWGFLSVLDLIHGRYLAFSVRTGVGLVVCAVEATVAIKYWRNLLAPQTKSPTFPRYPP